MRIERISDRKIDKRSTLGNRLLLLTVVIITCLSAHAQKDNVLRKTRKHTVSGYAHQENGEPLINVTVMNLSGMKGTVSNEHGFFSLTIPEGRHSIRFSYLFLRQRNRNTQSSDRNSRQCFDAYVNNFTSSKGNAKENQSFKNINVI